MSDDILMNIETLENFLPIFLGDEEKKSYIGYNIDVIRSSIDKQLYQPAWIYTNILFFVILYKFFWCLNVCKNDTVNKVLEEKILKLEEMKTKNIDKMFDLSLVPEKKFLEYLNQRCNTLHDNQIAEMKGFVDKRNHCAHASGYIQYCKTDINADLRKLLEYVEKIQNNIQIHNFEYILEIAESQDIYFLCTKELVFSKQDFRNFFEFLKRKTDCSFEAYERIVKLCFSDPEIYAIFTESELFDMISILISKYSYNDRTLTAIFQKHLSMYVFPSDVAFTQKLKTVVNLNKQILVKDKKDLLFFCRFG